MKSKKPPRSYLENRLKDIQRDRINAWTKSNPKQEEELSVEEMHADLTAGRAKLKPLHLIKRYQGRVRYVNIQDAFDFPRLDEKRKAAKEWVRQLNALNNALTIEISAILDRVFLGNASALDEIEAFKKESKGR